MAIKQTVLVVGATGATGRHVVNMLLEQGHNVRTVVRDKSKMMTLLSAEADKEKLDVTEASLPDLPSNELELLTKDCNAIVSCLGHRDIYGKPRRLVTEAVKNLCQAAIASNKDKKIPSKFILMGSNGVANPNGKDDIRPFSERLMLWLLSYLIPPHADNESAAQYLYDSHPPEAGGGGLEWCVVRPDDLIDTDVVTTYKLYEKPLPGLFGGGTASRRNVADSMVQLILEESLWRKWKYLMPVLDDSNDVQEVPTQAPNNQ